MTITGWDISGWSTVGVKEKEEREKREKASEAARACWGTGTAGIDREAAHIYLSSHGGGPRRARQEEARLREIEGVEVTRNI